MAEPSGLGIRQLELLPEAEAAGVLTDRPEGQYFERVSVRTEPRAIGDLMIGFANAEGGVIAIGIHSKVVEGTDGVAHLVNGWRQAAMDFTDPPVRHEFKLFPFRRPDGTRDNLALIEVEASETVHENRKGETFLRVGDENRRLNPAQAQELRFDKGQSAFDGTVVPEARQTDLDPSLIESYLGRVHGARRPNVVLEARGLLARKDDVLRPTVAGMLVLGRAPQRFFPEASLRLIRYGGVARETGARSNVRRDLRLDGPLSAQIDVARRHLRRWLPSVVRLGRAGRFSPSSLVPEYAWLEAIVNAVVHRSYSMAGDHTRVALFDDRLEVESPGRLPGLVRVETIRSTRFARNPRIARAMADLGFGRELGEGVNRMFEEMERVGLPTPLYTQPPASVKVTFLVETVYARILKDLPPGSERFIEWMGRAGEATTTQATDLLGQSRPVALRLLRRLEQQGLLEHVATSPKDPRGFWRVVLRAEPTRESST